VTLDIDDTVDVVHGRQQLEVDPVCETAGAAS